MEKYLLTNEQRYIGYIRTLECFSTALLKEDDFIIGSRIFEDMDIYIRTYLCEANLELFVSEDWIDEETADKSRGLRDTFCSLQRGRPELWNTESVKTAEEWRILMDLSEEIRNSLSYIPGME